MDYRRNNQQYGLLVSGGPTGTIYVSNCDLTGYTNTTPYVQQPLFVSRDDRVMTHIQLPGFQRPEHAYCNDGSNKYRQRLEPGAKGVLPVRTVGLHFLESRRGEPVRVRSDHFDQLWDHFLAKSVR